MANVDVQQMPMGQMISARGDNVRDALSDAGFDPSQTKDLLLNGQPCGLNDKVADGDFIAVTTKAEGGSTL